MCNGVEGCRMLSTVTGSNIKFHVGYQMHFFVSSPPQSGSSFPPKLTLSSEPRSSS